MATMSTSPGRPRGFDRAAALTTATGLFWAHGYDGTSMADLTRAMGISTSSLYAAFGDKRTLFEEAVLTYTRQYAAIYIAAALEEPTARAAAERILRESADAFTEPDRRTGCLTVSAALAGGADTFDVRQTLVELQAANVRVLRDKITEDVAAGVLPPATDPDLLADYVHALWQGLSNLSNNGTARTVLHDIIGVALRAWPTTPDAEDNVEELRRLPTPAAAPARPPSPAQPRGNAPGSGRSS